MQQNATMRKVIGAATLAAIVILLYLPSIHHSFIWDDDYYVTHNTALKDTVGLKKIWISPGTTPQYYPLVFTSFWLEYHLFGLNPAVFHATNIILHAINTVLVWMVLSQLGVPWAWMAAAVFAVHPVNAESVAWISERKNLMSCLFVLLSLWLLIRLYIRTVPGTTEPTKTVKKRWIIYLTALILFAFAMLSKSVTCVMPAVFLIIVWWKENRLTLKKFLSLIPFFATSLVAAVNTIMIEKAHVGAHGFEWDFSFPERLLIAGRALWFYAHKLIFPANIIFVYPRWHIDISSWWQWLYPVLALLVFATLWALKNRIGKGPFAGVAIFVVALMPALGFINYFPMRFSFVADHFQYMAQIAPIALIISGTHRIAELISHNSLNKATFIACAVVILLLGGRTLAEQEKYENLYTLWTDTLAKNPACWMAHNNLGVLLAKNGIFRQAGAHYLETIRLNPYFAQARQNLAKMRKHVKRLNTADLPYQQMSYTTPHSAWFYDIAGDAMTKLKRYVWAEWFYKKAINKAPGTATGFYKLGNLANHQNKFKKAIKYYRKAIQLQPLHAGAHRALGKIYIRLGKYNDALRHITTALKTDPFSARAYHDLGLVYRHIGKPDMATNAYGMALSINHFDSLARAAMSEIAKQKTKNAKKR